MTTAIDLFAGLGGWSTGARAAGVQVLWAANHWPVAVEWHSANHPDTLHVCQDLHQAQWEKVPAHDLLLASPCCQGHSKARGKASGNPQHDSSRSTAWAVVSALEFHRPGAALVENVPEFCEWALYPAWVAAVQALGYQVAPHVVDCADLGVPQHRVRLFLVITRSQAPLMLELHKRQHVSASSFLDFDAGRWSPIEKPGRAQATLDRVRNGRERFGDQFIMPYYGKGSGLTGRCTERPIGTITTLDRWALVRGGEMRMLSAAEALAAQTFPADTLRPDNHRLTMHMAGNAVPPLAGQRIIEALMETLCIYHAGCADGFGAAWVVRRLCPDAEFYAAKHGEPAPDATGKHVVIVDFSYPLEVLQEMAATAASVLVIDHHKTAQEDLAGLPQLAPGSLERHQLAAVFDMNRSGAGLTWDFFYPGQPRPALINHIEDRDLWRFQLEGTREILANLFSHPQDFEIWDELMIRPVAELRAEGAAIERAQQKELGDLLRATQRRMVIAGFDVPAANLPFTKASDAGHAMCAGEPFAAIYWDTPKGRSFSLRSTDAGEDVSAIATQFGGGGHRNAAGFSVPYGHELTLYAQPGAARHEPDHVAFETRGQRDE